MKFNFKNKSFVALAVVAALASCKPSLKDVTPSQGEADFTHYIAVGNSLTSGYADNGLYLEGQKNSFPEMLAAQMKNAGGGDFYTPFFDEAHANGSGYLSFTGFSATGTPVLTQITSDLAVRATSPVVLFDKYKGTEINNYGVPGIKLQHITLKNYGNLNGYFERLLPNDAPNNNNTSYLDFVTEKPFTFFSMWLGNNDILGYATGGGVGDVPTDKSTFTVLYNSAIDKLTANGAKGVVATIPNILTTPYFTTVTYASLKAAVGGNELYIQTGAGTSRAATEKDRFVLPLSSAGLIGVPNENKIPYGLHPLNPIENKYVLDEAEAIIVADYMNSYNSTIRNVANAKGLAIMDAGVLLQEYEGGKIVNGATVSTAFVTGNIFSLDGIHLTPMGYAIAANGFIKAINEKYHSTLSIVDIAKYRGVKFPAGSK